VIDLFWKPYDARYQELLGNLAFHRQILIDFLQLESYKDVVCNRNAASDALQKDAETRLAFAEIRMTAEKSKHVSNSVRATVERSYRGMMSALC
jgi:hypothetical protein